MYPPAFMIVQTDTAHHRLTPPFLPLQKVCDYQYIGHFSTSVDFCKKLKDVIDSYGDLKNMLRLRIIDMNNQWGKVIEILKSPPTAKAA